MKKNLSLMALGGAMVILALSFKNGDVQKMVDDMGHAVNKIKNKKINELNDMM